MDHKHHAGNPNSGRTPSVPAVFQLRLCRLRAGADSRHLTPPAPLSLTRRYDRRDGRRGENGSTSTVPDAGMATCVPSVFMHYFSSKTAPYTTNTTPVTPTVAERPPCPRSSNSDHARTWRRCLEGSRLAGGGPRGGTLSGPFGDIPTTLQTHRYDRMKAAGRPGDAMALRPFGPAARPEPASSELQDRKMRHNRYVDRHSLCERTSLSGGDPQPVRVRWARVRPTVRSWRTAGTEASRSGVLTRGGGPTVRSWKTAGTEASRSGSGVLTRGGWPTVPGSARCRRRSSPPIRYCPPRGRNKTGGARRYSVRSGCVRQNAPYNPRR